MLLSLVLAALATPALAAGVIVSHATLRVITPAVPAAGYFDLKNTSAKAIALTDVHSPMCGSLMMHQSTTGPAGLSRMVPALTIIIPPQSTLRFKPGGYHLMCELPSRALATTHTAAVTFVFGDGVTQNATFAVVDAKGRPR